MTHHHQRGGQLVRERTFLAKLFREALDELLEFKQQLRMRIQIVGRYRRGIINLSIRNSLPPAIPDREKTRHGNRMAVQNVSQRLEAMYPGTARMSQSRIEGDYLVRLSFPYTRSQA